MDHADATLIGTWQLPQIVYGFDSTEFEAITTGDIASFSNLYVVFNDTGTVSPPVTFPPADLNTLSTQTIFPPSGYAELGYNNNVDSITIEPTTALALDTVICIDDAIELDIEDLFADAFCLDSVWWESQKLGFIGNDEILPYLVQGDDQVTATIRSSSGIEISATVTILSSSTTVSIPDTVYTISQGESVRLVVVGSNGNSYWWTPEGSLSNPFEESPLAFPSRNTLYTLEVTNDDECESTYHIQVWVETAAYIPNLFTPNGDGKNDFLRAYGLVQVDAFDFRIFSKHGAQVYFANDPNMLTGRGWEGSYQNKPLPSSTYFWEVSGTYEDGRPVLLNGESSGVIHLVR